MSRIAFVFAAVLGTSAGWGALIPRSTLMATPERSFFTYAGFGLSVATTDAFTGHDDNDNDDWDGLWFGFTNRFGPYTFTFDAEVTNLKIKFTAHNWNEQWDGFHADGELVLVALSDNNVAAHETYLTGGSILQTRALPAPQLIDGWGTVVYSGTFTTFEFNHRFFANQRGNGTVITEMSWDVVPEPGSALALGAGACR